MDMDISPFILPAQEQIANKFGYSYKELSSLIYPTTSQSYETFVIPKKNGETRVINAPRIKLLKIQQTFAEELTKIYSPKKCTHGFIKEKSIVTNAEKHTNKKYVFNIDLKDFFPSIHFGRVRNLLMSAPFNYHDNEATILAQICCHNGVLPQGAPTSPIISNMICWKMDAQLQRLAIDNRCTYTRYADDITFSFNVSKAKLPRSILRLNTKTDEVSVSPPLEKIIQENGFQVNGEKVRFQGRNQRQEVTGITVNRGLNLKRSYIRQTASMLYAWRKFGAALAEKEYLEKYRLKAINYWQKERAEKADGKFFIDVVKGRINFIRMVKGQGDPVYRKLAFQLTEALGVPNESYRPRHDSCLFVIDSADHVALDDVGQGTAFLLDKVGLVTNAHVVPNISETNFIDYDIFRHYETQKKRKCSLVTVSQEFDICVLKPHNDFINSSPYTMGCDKNLKTGDIITVIGFPSYSPSMTPCIRQGRITAKKNIEDKSIWLVDATINHGCSGGPVLNHKGEVIGIATCGKANNSEDPGFNGFIPISYLIDLLAEKKQEDAA